MVVQTFCASGESEGLKGAVHGAACVIAAAMAAYNITAWHFRHQPHLATNAVVYTLAVAWEMKQTLRHLRRCVPSESSQAQAA
jgi:hypothetical protein